MPNNPDRPYGKINLLSRKKKDQKNVAFLNKKIETGGTHSFEKKSNKPMEVVKGTFIAKRGTKVSGGSKTVTSVSPAKSENTISAKSSGLKTGYEPADVRTGDKKYGKESATNPTPQFVKDAQAKRQTIVEKDGLKYRAGNMTVDKGPTEFSASTKVTPGKISMIKKKELNVSAPKPAPARNSSGITLMKRKADTVPWLKGKGANQKKESGHGSKRVGG